MARKKMDPKLKKQWLEALRSGEYPKTECRASTEQS